MLDRVRNEATLNQINVDYRITNTIREKGLMLFGYLRQIPEKIIPKIIGIGYHIEEIETYRFEASNVQQGKD